MKDNKGMNTYGKPNKETSTASKPIIINLPDFPAKAEGFVSVPIQTYNYLMINTAILEAVKRVVTDDISYLRDALCSILEIKQST